MLTVSQVARKARVAPNTVRNHVRDFPDLFSEAARGLKGNRLFNENDVEAICSLVALKDSGMPLAEAALRLRSQEAPTVIDIAATPMQEAASPQEARHAPLATLDVQSIVLSRFEAIERRLDAKARSDMLWHIGTGFWLGIVFCGFVLWVLYLFG